MKTILATLLWFSTIFLATVSAAEPAIGPKPRIQVGVPFSFKVISVDTWKTSKSGITTTGGPIPRGIPKYKIGETITFEIAKNHNLTWKNHSVPFHNRSRFTGTYYYEGPTRKFTSFVGVSVNAKNKPVFMSLSFYGKTKSGVHHHVIYILE